MSIHHRKPTVGLPSLTSREVKCTNSLFYRYAIFLKCGKPIRKIEIPNGFLLSKFLVIRDESTAFPVVDEYHSWLRRDPGDNITSPVWTLVHVNVYSTHKYKHAARYTRVTWTYTKLANRQMPWNKISYGRCHIECPDVVYKQVSCGKMWRIVELCKGQKNWIELGQKHKPLHALLKVMSAKFWLLLYVHDDCTVKTHLTINNQCYHGYSLIVGL